MTTRSTSSTNPNTTASNELIEAFKSLQSDTSLRGLLITIEKESLVPSKTIPSTSSDFSADLSNLTPHLTPTQPLYILLRQDNASTFVAITYVPNTAPVRQKMLFASTRLTLVRELGIESFGEQIFVENAEELSVEGWRKHQKHVQQENPLTEEERNLVDIKNAEATEVGGTSRRGAGYGSGGLKMQAGEGVVEALSNLQEGGLVSLKIDTSETIVLAEAPASGIGAGDLAQRISNTEPRYSVYKYSYSGASGPETASIFIYTCPTATKVKDRMVYASSRRSAEVLAEQGAGLKLDKKVCSVSTLNHMNLTLTSIYRSKLPIPATSLHNPSRTSSLSSRSRNPPSRNRSDQVGDDLHHRKHLM
jgi:twinfilin-like protein